MWVKPTEVDPVNWLKPPNHLTTEEIDFSQKLRENRWVKSGLLEKLRYHWTVSELTGHREGVDSVEDPVQDCG